MQLFCIAYGRPSTTEQSLSAALEEAGRAFHGFEGGPSWSVTSRSGKVVAAGRHHPDSMIGPRRYHAQRGDVLVAYDGLPVHRTGEWRGDDADTLLTHWSELNDVLEGQFSCMRVDLALDQVVLLTDTCGIGPLYCHADGGHFVVSNSVEAIRLVARLDEPNALGVSSFAAMGWPVADSTLLSKVQALPGGCEYRLTDAGLVRLPSISSATVASVARSGRRPAADEVAHDLIQLTGAAAATGLPIECGLTAGRDTRLLLALLEASGAPDVLYYTGGVEGNPDVDGAQLVARETGIPHELRRLDVVEDSVDAGWLTKTFVTQTDGLSSLMQIGDYNDQLNPPSLLGLKTPGLGGEFGRSGVGRVPYAANVPLFMYSQQAQEQLLMEWARVFKSLWTDDALNEVHEYIRRFVRDSREQGWKTREVAEVFYSFDRVWRWGSTSVRRTSATHDFFTPFCSRSFLNYAFTLSPEERYVEASHYRLLSSISPRLRDLPYLKPWPKQEPRLVPLRATYDLGRRAWSEFTHRSNGKPGPPRYWTQWFEASADLHREVCLSATDSPLWNWIDRAAVERAFNAEPSSRAGVREGLLRTATLFWYFHGRHER